MFHVMIVLLLLFTTVVHTYMLRISDDNSYCQYDLFDCNATKMYSLEGVNNTKGVKLFLVNIRSVLQHQDEIKVILESNHLDIVVLTES